MSFLSPREPVLRPMPIAFRLLGADTQRPHAEVRTRLVSFTPNINLVKELRSTLQARFPPPGRMEKTAYGYEHDRRLRKTFRRTESQREELGLVMRQGGSETTMGDAVETFLADHLVRVVYGSNLIETVGTSLDLTRQICVPILHGKDFFDPRDEIDLSDDQYNALRVYLYETGPDSDHAAVVRSRREVIQHCRALRYLLDEFVLQDRPLCEQIILNTHKILVESLDSSFDAGWKTLAGKYRTDERCSDAGLATVVPACAIPERMADLIDNFNEELDTKPLDPYNLAAKYSHALAVMQPFREGSGRIGRLLLNAILMKYAGTAVAIGANDTDREYLAIAAEGCYDEHYEHHLGKWKRRKEYTPPHWKRLAAFTVSLADRSIQEFWSAIQGTVPPADRTAGVDGAKGGGMKVPDSQLPNMEQYGFAGPGVRRITNS